jgi:ubiquitin C-terminal hydrolase
MRELIKFDEVLDINDRFVSPNLRVGIFNTKVSQPGVKVEYKPTQYRLFSVVEHCGEFAHRGHYVCYTLDSEDHWKCFDDQRVSERDIDTILLDTQAYILFYELI